jgi:O-antigen/teichoic acid export membrane protein
MLPPSLARGAALNLAARLVTVALGLVILVAVARLGPLVQGAFALFVAVESVLLTLFSGLGLLLAREVSSGQLMPGPRLAARLGALLKAAAAFGLAAGILLAGASAFSHAEPYRHLWLLALAAPFLLWVPTASGLWLGQGRMGPLNAPQVAAPALVLAGLWVMGLLPWGGVLGGVPSVSAQPAAEAGHAVVAVGALGVLAAWVSAKALVGILTAAAVLLESRRPVGPPPAAAPLAQAPVRAAAQAASQTSAPPVAWRFVAVIGATNVLSLLNYRTTLFLVERQAGLAEAGVYSVAVQVAELLWLLSSAVTVSAYHRIGAPDAAQAVAITLRAVRFNLVATLAAAPLLYGLATWALPVWLGPAYASALGPLALLLPGIAGYAAASSLSAYYTHHLGRPQWSARIAGLSLGLTLAIAAWSIPRYGAPGAALATSLAYVLAIAVALRAFLRDTGLPWRALLDPALPAGAATRQLPPA